MTPGYKTTEFWLALIAQLLGAVMASGALGADHWALQVAGVIAAALAAMGYGASRAAIKKQSEAALKALADRMART